MGSGCSPSSPRRSSAMSAAGRRASATPPPDAVWAQIERGAGTRLDFRALRDRRRAVQPDHLRLLRRRRWFPFLDDRDPRGPRRFAMCSSATSAGSASPAPLCPASRPRWRAWWPATRPPQCGPRWRPAPHAPSGCGGCCATGRGSRPVTFVMHYFMDADGRRPGLAADATGGAAATRGPRETQERLAACHYAMAHPETGTLVPACVQHGVLDPGENAALRTLLPIVEVRTSADHSSARHRRRSSLMRIGVITGSGSYDWPHLEGAADRTVVTDHGEVTVTEGRLGDAEIVQLSRHSAGHHRLSNQVDHKANLAACWPARRRPSSPSPSAAPSTWTCSGLPGGLRRPVLPRQPAARRHPRTWTTPPARQAAATGSSRALQRATAPSALTAAEQTGAPVATQGVYGHVDGPRFNTRPEVAALAAAGVQRHQPQTGVRRSSSPVKPHRPGAGRIRHRLHERRAPDPVPVPTRRSARMAASPGALHDAGLARAAFPDRR